MNNEQLKALLASYGRSVLGAAAALYMAGVPTEDLLYSLIAAIAPVALRALNPSDTAFGRVPAVEDIEEALKTVKVKKAPAKKAPVKKAPAKKATPRKPSGGGGGGNHQVM
jgi:hypothetical protein